MTSIVSVYKLSWKIDFIGMARSCPMCSKFLPKSGICTGCGCDVNDANIVNVPGSTSSQYASVHGAISMQPSTGSSLVNIGGSNSSPGQSPGLYTQPSQVPLSPDLKDIHTCLQEIKAKLNTLDDLVARVNVCTSSVNTLRSSVSDIAARVDNLSSDQHLLDRRLTVIEQSQSIATTSGAAASVSPPAPFLDVTRRIARIEQSNRDHELVISGIPSNANDGPVHVIAKIAEAIKVPFTPSDVSSTIWLKSSNAAFKTLIIRFTSTLIRDDWISKKRIKKDLRAGEIIPTWPGTLVYINERSTVSERNTLKQAKKLAKEHNFKYVWMRRGITYIKKDDASKTARFSLPLDLNNKEQ